MKTTIGKHAVEYHDAIDELPVVRFHKYQKYLLVDAGIGSDLSAFDRRMETVRRFMMTGKAEQAMKEIENARQCVFFIQSELSPKMLAFAALVTNIDGRDCSDVSDGTIAEVAALLSDVPVSDVDATLASVKKKIDSALMLYFPALFEDSTVKEYYNILRRRTIAVLEGIVSGAADPEATQEADRITTELMTYSNPRVFSGADGAEVQTDRQFENLCLVLSEQLNVEPKKFTVMEFYNAFDFVKERAKQAKNGASARKGRINAL